MQAGWYQHPEDLTGLLRWWDGAVWTSATQAVQQPAPYDPHLAMIEEMRRQGAASRRAAARRHAFWRNWIVFVLIVGAFIGLIFLLDYRIGHGQI